MNVRTALSSAVTSFTDVVGGVAVVFLSITLLTSWIIVGFVHGFGGHWVDVIHAVAGGTTFIMVFVLRHAEGREARAMLVKLDELVAAMDDARNDVIGVEKADLKEQERIEDRRDG